MTPLSRFAVVDVETNGFSASADVIEIAVVHPERMEVVFDTLVKPGKRIGNREIHGITNRDIRHAPRLADVLGALCEVLVDRIVVAHNASFDLRFLERALTAAAVPVRLPRLCTMALQERLTGDKADLERACALNGITFDRGRHRAADDAVATAGLLVAQLPRIGALEVDGELLSDLVARSVSGRAPLRPRTQPR